MLYDPLYFILAIPPLLLGFYAQFKVKSTYKKFSKIGAISGLTGLEASERLLSHIGASDVEIKIIPGELSDNYDSSKNILSLSEGTAKSSSIAAIGIAAHELGHVAQDKDNYGFMAIRSAIVPAVKIGSTFGYVLFILGLIIGISGLTWAGVLLFSVTTLFTLVTLPVEFNASSRAIGLVTDSGLLMGDELNGAKAVLNAAALTYVAAAFQSIMNLLYFIMRARD